MDDESTRNQCDHARSGYHDVVGVNVRNSRRRFLNRASAVLAAAMAACRKPTPDSTALPPGAPPTFGAGPNVGPPVSTSTFAEAEKLVQFKLSQEDRRIAASNWSKSMAPLYERRTGPRKFSPPPSVAPASRWDPASVGQQAGPEQPVGPARDRLVRPANLPRPLPARAPDIPFPP